MTDHIVAAFQLLEEDLRVVVGCSEDRRELGGGHHAISLDEIQRRFLVRFDGSGLQVGIHVPQDFFERVPGPPSVHVPGLVVSSDHERRETADAQRLAFVSVPLERLVRGPVVQGLDERVDLEVGLLGDLRLDGPRMYASSLEAPRLPQATEIAPTLIGSLDVRGLRGDARRPRRIEIVGGIEHRVRVHRHPMLAGHGLEERADGIFPAASGHPRPLFSHGAEVLEQAALARLDPDGVRVADLQTADRWLEAPAPDVVRVGVPDHANRRAHARVSARVSGGLLRSPRFRGVGTLMAPDSRRRAMRLDDRQWAGLLLFVGIAQFAIIGLTVAESVYPGYSVSQKYISDLGVGPAALIFDPSIILVGLVVLATAWFLLRAFKDRLVSIVVALGGAGAIAVGVFTEDFGVIHCLVSPWTFIFIALSAILAMRIVRPPFQYISVLLGLLSLAALGLYISKTYLGLGPGGMERMIVWPVLVWGLAFGGYLFASSPSASGTSVTP